MNYEDEQLNVATTHRVRSRLNKRPGMATVELAAVLPLLVLVTFGMVELGWYLHLSQIIHNAARQGARAAVRLENSNAQVEAIVHNCLYKDAGIAAGSATIEMTCLSWEGAELYQIMSLDENEHGEPVRVTVSVDECHLGALANLLGLNEGGLSTFAVVQRQQGPE